jgi:homoserine dehydrogenase
MTLRLALVGFGNVGRRFVELLGGAYGGILGRAGVEPLVTGIATARHGSAIDERGWTPERCLRCRSLDTLHKGKRISSTLDFIRRVPADVLLELTTLNPRTGQPAVGHVRAGLDRGLHVVTANKGPAAVALRQLRELANRKKRAFLFEGAVMDGTPVFNLVARCLPGVRVLGFRGVLNTTSSRILSAMEQGRSFDEALAEMQDAGIAEADPGNDVDGWDAAAKGCAIANALMDADTRPARVNRTGIAEVAPDDVLGALRMRKRIRLVVRGERDGPRVHVSVAPEALPLDDVLVAADQDGVLILETDLMGEIGILEGPSGIDQTAYALLSDLMTIVRARPRG